MARQERLPYSVDYIATLLETAEIAPYVLDERELDVLTRRYKKGQTLAEIGRQFGITRERVRQLERRAVSKLKTLYNWRYGPGDRSQASTTTR